MTTSVSYSVHVLDIFICTSLDRMYVFHVNLYFDCWTEVVTAFIYINTVWLNMKSASIVLLFMYNRKKPLPLSQCVLKVHCCQYDTFSFFLFSHLCARIPTNKITHIMCYTFFLL